MNIRSSHYISLVCNFTESGSSKFLETNTHTHTHMHTHIILNYLGERIDTMAIITFTNDRLMLLQQEFEML